MEIKITWSTLSKQQLKDIGQYVADNFGERTANKSLERIVKKVNSLYVFPESGSFDKKYSTDSYSISFSLRSSSERARHSMIISIQAALS